MTLILPGRRKNRPTPHPNPLVNWLAVPTHLVLIKIQTQIYLLDNTHFKDNSPNSNENALSLVRHVTWALVKEETNPPLCDAFEQISHC